MIEFCWSILTFHQRSGSIFGLFFLALSVDSSCDHSPSARLLFCVCVCVCVCVCACVSLQHVPVVAIQVDCLYHYANELVGCFISGIFLLRIMRPARSEQKKSGTRLVISLIANRCRCVDRQQGGAPPGVGPPGGGRGGGGWVVPALFTPDHAQSVSDISNPAANAIYGARRSTATDSRPTRRAPDSSA